LAKRIVENVLLNGGFGVNIMTNELKFKLGLQLAKLKPYHLRMANQTTTKLLDLIKNFKIAIDGTSYQLVRCKLFYVIGKAMVERCQNLTWIRYKNMVTIEGNGMGQWE